MATMGKYCKAYPIKRLREFSGWTEKAENARKEKQTGADGKEVDMIRALTGNDYLYLQENYAVTDGIFKDENIIFDQVTPEWIAYCHEALKFEIPSFASTAKESADPQG
ncbi:MAG: hypothetical protein CVU38_04110 [Chloroflexi bacterium HGW-Chloroflexi-1]|nr:MAG: hypothetical protein CVU38_04110 [Chloroflexi bacterium HGW-Chloroflexi-1]